MPNGYHILRIWFSFKHPSRSRRLHLMLRPYLNIDYVAETKRLVNLGWKPVSIYHGYATHFYRENLLLRPATRAVLRTRADERRMVQKYAQAIVNGLP